MHTIYNRVILPYLLTYLLESVASHPATFLIIIIWFLSRLKSARLIITFTYYAQYAV